MALLFTGLRLSDSGNLVGDTLMLKHQESSNANFTMDTPTVNVNGPTGLMTPSVTVIPGTAAEVQLVQATVSEAVAGQYQVDWIMPMSDGQTVMRSEIYFVSWTELYTNIRALLRLDSTVLLNSDMDMVLSQIITMITGPGMYQTVLPSYSGLILADRIPFDQALTLMAAAYLRPFLPKQVATGEVVKFQSGTDVYQWAQPVRNEKNKPIEEIWIDRSWELLVATQTIGNIIRNIQDNAPFFRANGYRRRQINPIVLNEWGEIYQNPLFTRWSGWLETGRDFSFSWGRGNGW